MTYVAALTTQIASSHRLSGEMPAELGKEWTRQRVLTSATEDIIPKNPYLLHQTGRYFAGNTHQIFECLNHLDSDQMCCITIYVCFAN